MSNLSTIKPSVGSQTRKTRLARGRGSGVGGTCGRGMNGQNSRTGTGKRYPTFEGGQTPLFRRTPKKRGFTSYKPEQFVLVNLDQIEALALDGVTVVDYAILYERRIIREKGKLLKVLGRGEVKSAFTVTADAISASAKVAIEKAGGTVSIPEVVAE
ncbi:50S ribosomal protein L15 [Candidatus Gracilibacteria bacterium]|nr:50S ribosomal protein L15 [Candidatus Gracilibacteria bacterium]